MNRSQMLVNFRQYAQQMGMQQTRVLLDEQIDILLNTSMIDILNQLLKEHISATTEKGGADNSKLAQFNSFRNLYIVKEIKRNNDLFDEGETTVINGINVYTFDSAKVNEIFTDALHLIGGSVGYSLDKDDNNEDIIYKFPARLIAEQYLAESLVDSFLRPSIKSPILIICNDTNRSFIKLYTKVSETIELYEIDIEYIKKPTPLGPDNEVCEIPEHLHELVVRHGVELYKATIGQNTAGQAQPTQQYAQ